MFRECLVRWFALSVMFVGALSGWATEDAAPPPPSLPEACSLAPRDFPIMFVHSPDKANEAQRDAVAQTKKAIADGGMTCFEVGGLADGMRFFDSRKDLGGIVVDWSSVGQESPAPFFARIRERNPKLPLFIITDKKTPSEMAEGVYRQITGYLWTLDDTASFNAGVIRRAALAYQAQLLPPMFKALVDFVNQRAYNWSTPGHSGGAGMLRTPAGTAFLKFFGENIFRGDVSTTVGSVGDALLHTGSIGEAERQAAKTFGADLSYFVLNGTSNTNRIVFSGVMTSGDVALVDRNCHKSAMQGMILTQSKPVYLMPNRNKLGVIGPIALEEFSRESVQKKLADAGHQGAKPRLSMVTTPTYDGLLYQSAAVKKALAGQVDNMLFDEAWYAYGKFHPLYAEYYAMAPTPGIEGLPTVFAGHSVHKLLAAFSQGSLLHIKNGAGRQVDPDRFNQAFLMHCSTSPFTPLLASIDASVKMMEQPGGYYLIQDMLQASVSFRKKVLEIYKAEKANGGWFFRPWQPDMVTFKTDKGETKRADFLDVPDQALLSQSGCWTLNPGEAWHGFDKFPANYAMLDPLKVTLVSPGLNLDGSMDETGIPMLVVEAFLQENGMFSEKFGFYLDLILFSPGCTEGKAGTMIAKLLDFKAAYDQDMPLAQALPKLVAAHPDVYGGMTLRQLCHSMHRFFKDKELPKIAGGAFDAMPELAMLPSDAYYKVVRGQTEYVPVAELEGRVAAGMVVPYPPGIPILMPGERLTAKNRDTLAFIKFLEELDSKFPEFGLHVHGIKKTGQDGSKVYLVDCVKKDCE